MTTNSSRWRFLLAVLTALALVAAACGGSDGDDEEASGDDATETEATSEGDNGDTGDEMSGTDEAMSETESGGDGEVATDVGIDDETIKLGVLTDLTGPFAALTVPMADGYEAYFEWLNDNGGIAGREVELVIRDTAYDVDNHTEFYDAMRGDGDEGVVMLLSSLGSPQTAAIRDTLVEDQMAAIPVSWNSSWASEANANIFEFSTNYCIEALNGISWMSAEHGSKVAVVSIAGDYGEDGAIGAKQAVEDLGLELVYDGQGAIQRGADPTPVVAEIVDSGADFVWITATPTEFAQIVGGATAAGFEGAWGGNNPNYNSILLASAQGETLDAVYTNFAPGPVYDGAPSEAMDEITSIMQEYRPDAPFVASYVTSWTQGEIARQGLEAAFANGDATRAGVLAALSGLTIDMKGLQADIDYSGDANAAITRGSFVYDVDLASYQPGATVSDGTAGADGLVLLEADYVSDLAAEVDYEPCFEI